MKLPFSAPRSWADLVANFEALAKLLPGVGDRSRGNSTLTWPGALQVSNVQTVQHGLRRTPVQVLCQISVPIGNTATRGFTVEIDEATITDTSFQVRGWCSALSPPAAFELPFHWEAIG